MKPRIADGENTVIRDHFTLIAASAARFSRHTLPITGMSAG